MEVNESVITAGFHLVVEFILLKRFDDGCAEDGNIAADRCACRR
jgi:hypothetical protein